MIDRAVISFVFVLAALAVGSSATPSAEATAGPSGNRLIEHEAPIVVEAAPTIDAGDSLTEHHSDHDRAHVVSVETHAAMLNHAERIQAVSESADAARIGVPPAGYAASRGGMVADYNTSYPSPSAVRAVVNAAVARWDSVLATNPSGPIVVEVFWSDLGDPSLLGYAGPDGLYQGGGLPTSSLYPAALANTLLGIDANGAARPEIQVVLNLQLLANNRWYLGSSGTPGAGQVDLFSVVLHEIGHGLGFLGSATVPNGQSSPSLNSPTYVYDTKAVFNNAPLTGAPNQAAALRSSNLHFQISNSTTYKLYAPSNWRQGTSFSHFDESAYRSGSAGALMTPLLGNREVARVIDTPTLGVMAAIGWPTTVRATTPRITALSPSRTAIVASWDQNFRAVGLAPDSYTVEAWRDGSVLQSSVTVAGDITSATLSSLTPGRTYRVVITPNGRGGKGTSTSAVTTLSAAGGPSTWPGYIRDLPLDGQIIRLYQAYFLRLPDESGFNYWIDQRARRMPLGDISSAFASGREFQNRYGSLSNQAFVNLVYANVLNRAPDAAGRAYWVNQLNQGLSRGEVMVGFAESVEFINRTGTARPGGPNAGEVARLYRAFFLRNADPNGMAYWTDQANSGVSLEAISAAFTQSTEFQTSYGSLTDRQFVQLVYRNVLGRNPDTSGLNYWVSQLATGMDRGTVMVGFSESPEFIKSTGTIP